MGLARVTLYSRQGDGLLHTWPDVSPVTPPGGAVGVGPTARITTTSVADLAITLSATTSSDSTVGAVIESYVWNFGDGSTAVGPTAQHTYAAAGLYQVRLVVTDNLGAADATTLTVRVASANLAPIASLSLSKNGLTVTGDASASTDPDGTIVAYGYAWGDGGADPASASPIGSHTYTQSGTYFVTVYVKDDAGAVTAASQTITVTSAAAPPVASFTITPNAMSITADGGGSYDPDGTVVRYDWDWGDGSAHGSGAVAGHTYATTGPWPVTLTVTDSQGLTATYSDLATPSPALSGSDALRQALPDDGSYEPFARLSYANVGPFGSPQATLPTAQITAGLMPSTLLAGEGSLTVHTGNITYSDSSSLMKVIRDTKFVGKVSVTGQNYTFKNCLFLGSANNSANFQCTNDNARNILLEDCEIRGANTNNNDYTDSDGIYGHDFTTRRVWIHGVVDGVHPNPRSDGTVNWHDYGSVINGLSYYSPWHYQSNNASHNDCIQINGGHGIYLTGTKLEAFYDTTIGQALVDASGQVAPASGNFYYPNMQATSCLMGTPLSKPSGNYVFSKCWFDGGAYSFNFASNTPAYDAPVTFDRCVFGTRQRVPNARIMVIAAAQPFFTATNNTLRDGTPANQIGNS